MKAVVVVLIGLNLGWIIYQDFKERTISLVALFVLFVLCVVYYSLALQFRELPVRIVINSLFAGVILVSGTLLVKIRRPKDSVSSFIGAGDFLFLMAISPMFSFESYLVFLNTSIVFTLVIYGILLVVGRITASHTIPLAGALAICLIVFVSLNQMLPFNLFEEISWIYSIQG